MGMTRAQIRENIFKLLFRVEFNPMDDMQEQVALFFQNPDMGAEDEGKLLDMSPEDETYITDKYDRIVERLPELDELINSASKGWKTNRLGKVELTILRLAVYEMKFDEDIPVSVAINEAVELAKKFGQEESASFINGVLAKLAQTTNE